IGFFLCAAVLILSCTLNTRKKRAEDGAALATKWCSSCHLFPEPSLLDKSTWLNDVLPAMAPKLGLDIMYETTMPGFDSSNAISIDEWRQLIYYYNQHAPDSMPAQNRPLVNLTTDRFVVQLPGKQTSDLPATSMVKIDSTNQRIYIADAIDSSLNMYDAKTLQLVSRHRLKNVLVDMDFGIYPKHPGTRTGIATYIGIMHPNDELTGSVHSFSIDRNATDFKTTLIADSLPRPVQSLLLAAPSVLICGFGNQVKGGAFIQTIDGRKPLIERPGALHAQIIDVEKDGKLDIVVLMAQANEGIYLLRNQDSGKYESRELVKFSPLNGSSYFELIDFDKDGDEDILYTAGDNADYSAKALKNYHGVYIFVNDGKWNFKKQYFFPINGCYKAMARDFDGDGDLDIAAISYFPDPRQLNESFVYLEQRSMWQFTASTVSGVNTHGWITMDVGDADGDGDQDVVLGGMNIPGRKIEKDGKVARGFVVLRNRLR
ncbi:MAG: VCBS repeat-containing protein, partial [Chitinophagaceae bacterium]|nr:VCBS repeat-containing protein [Chitinophagaceae bacterium]